MIGLLNADVQQEWNEKFADNDISYIYESNHFNGFNNWNVDFQHAKCTSVASRAQEKTQGEIEHQDDKRAESREQASKLAGRQAGRRASGLLSPTEKLSQLLWQSMEENKHRNSFFCESFHFQRCEL